MKIKKLYIGETETYIKVTLAQFTLYIWRDNQITLSRHMSNGLSHIIYSNLKVTPIR